MDHKGGTILSVAINLADSVYYSHTFKLLPNIGKHVVELIEGSLPQDLAHAWRWRPGAEGDPLRSGRASPPKDLADMPGWKHDAKL